MTRLFLYLCWLLLASATGYAQEFSWAAAGADQKQAVSQKLQRHRGLCIVQVSIDNHSYDFLFDTGAPTVISKKIFNRIQPSAIGTVKVLDALGNAAVAPVVMLSQIELSGLGIQRIPALVYDTENPIFTSIQVQGILGSNALHHLSVDISVKNETIGFSSAGSDSQWPHSINMELSNDAQGSPFIDAVLGGFSEKFLFDSGFEGLVDLSVVVADSIQNHGAVAVRTLHSTGTYTGINGSGKGVVQKLPPAPLVLSGMPLGDVQATVTGDSRSKIGAALLDLGDVTLDYPNRRFSFVPYRRNR